MSSKKLTKINPKILEKPRLLKAGLSDLVNGIYQADRSIMGQALSLFESNKAEDIKMSRALIESFDKNKQAKRIAITGVPGVGKSTFIEALGEKLCGEGHKVAVLAIDPSSQKTGGAILGDKTRMEKLSRNPNAFIRPSSAGSVLGGIAKNTYQSILLCEAAGFDIILIETVGVGQSETIVQHMADFFLLLMLAGAGDELQGIKRGIMELADFVFINKAEEHNLAKAKEAMRQYRQALHLFQAKESGWNVKVEVGSALESTGLNLVWSGIKDFYKITEKNSYLSKYRESQSIALFEYFLQENILHDLQNDKGFQTKKAKSKKGIISGNKSPFDEAKDLSQLWIKKT